MKMSEVHVGDEVQCGANDTWPDEPRRARVEAIEKRSGYDTHRQVRVVRLTLAGDVDEYQGTPWWRPAELTPWAEWFPGWKQRESRRNHRASIRQRLAEALHAVGLGDLVTVDAGKAGTVHMVIGDLTDTERVAAHLRRLADTVGGPAPR